MILCKTQWKIFIEKRPKRDIALFGFSPCCDFRSRYQRSPNNLPHESHTITHDAQERVYSRFGNNQGKTTAPAENLPYNLPYNLPNAF